MRTIRRSIPPALLVALLACAPAALAQAGAAPVAAGTTPAGAAPAAGTTTAAPAAPVAASISVRLTEIKLRFAAVGQRMALRGTVSRFVPDQSVVYRVFENGRVHAVHTLRITPGPNLTGVFAVGVAADVPGMLHVVVLHRANAKEGAATARTAVLPILSGTVALGERSREVSILQNALDVDHYLVPRTGVYDDLTGLAVQAFRKVAGLGTDTTVDSDVVRELSQGDVTFHVRFPGEGDHVEGDLTRQVLAEIGPHGRVYKIITMSSGKPSTPTVVGNFSVYLKTPGTNSEGMVDANYFIRGYAIHGYFDVPPYPASHGCLRIPIPDAAAVFDWVQIGDPVNVYYESGGGSQTVRGNAGP